MLPFGQLIWENFERLCKALVETEDEIRACHLYGRQGHQQHGIDLIAFAKDLKDAKPRVYQCKRVEEFTAAHIKGVVKKFKDNLPILRRKWKTLPSRFVLCCRGSLRSPACQDEYIRQRSQLAQSEISFEIWDEDELSTQLKDHERIVDDFFDRGWVKAFNGVEAALALSQKFELSSTEARGPADPLVSLVISRDLEIQALTGVVDQELSARCKEIRDEFKQGHQQKSLNDVRSYLDRFETDLHQVPASVRAKFWYTAGVLTWKLPANRSQSRSCLEKARQIDPSLDIRDLSARILFAEDKFDEAVQVLDPVNTQHVATLKLALLLDLRRLEQFDILWTTGSFDRDDGAYELLAYRQRLDRRFTEAQQSIQTSLESAPGIPSHLLAAGHIAFWSAVPEHLDLVPRSVLPAGLHPIFYAPTDVQVQLLDRAVNYYLQAISLFREAGPSEVHQVREIEEYLLLCRAYHPLQRAQAQELALRLLSDDPTIFFALFYCLQWEVPFDADRSAWELDAKRTRQQASVNDLYVLVQLHKRLGSSDKAVLLLEVEKQRFSTEREESVWMELMIGLYVETGQASKARVLRESSGADTVSSLRLQALGHEVSGNQEELEKIAFTVWEMSQSLIDLVNLCGFYRKAEQWAKLEPFAAKLAALSPDPRSLWLLIESLYRTQQHAQCLATIERHRSVWLEPSLVGHVQRIEVECLIKLNRLDRAVIQLEGIRRERPSAEIAQRLAHAYFRLGRQEQALTVLREATARPDADAQLLIGTSQLLIHESPEEAFRLAQRAKDTSTQDPSVWMHYIKTGFMTGHDREAGETLHSFREQFPTSIALEHVAISEALERMAQHRQAQQDRWGLYRRGGAPIHVLMDVEHHPLGFDWYVRFESNLNVATWNKKLPLFTRHGGRGLDAGSLPIETTGIVMDYTSLLLSHRVGLLPFIERAFERIVLPPSTLSLLQTESYKTAQFQLSRVRISQVVKAAIDTGSILVLQGNPTDEALTEFQLQELGRADALLFYLAKQEGGLVLVQQLTKEAIDQVELQEALAKVRVFPIEVLTAMTEMGAMTEQELNTVLGSCLGQPCRKDRIASLVKKPKLVLDGPAGEFLAHCALLDRAAQIFCLCMPASEVAHITFTLHEYKLRQECADWLSALNHYLSEKLNAKYFFPTTALPDTRSGERGSCSQVLEEAFYTTRDVDYPLWSDDRMVNRHAYVEGKPIVTVDAVLTFLRSKGMLSSERYFEHLLLLIKLDVLFLPLDPEFLIHYLRLAGLNEKGLLKETYELKAIRRYIASIFSRGTALHPSPMEQGKPSEAATYFYHHREACREVLADIWTDISLTEQYKRAASKWIIEQCWKGIEDIAHLEGHPLNPELASATSHALLIGNGLVMMIHNVERPGENAASYLSWLYEQYLESHWESNPQVRQLVLQNVRCVTVLMVNERTGDEKEVLLRLMAHVWANTSKDFSREILDDEQMKSIFQGYLRPTVLVSDGLKVLVTDWDQWAFEAITSGTGAQREMTFEDRKLIVQWYETSVFLSGLAIHVPMVDGATTTMIQVDPFLKLRHPSRDVRERALQRFTAYLVLAPGVIDTMAERVRSESGWESVAAEVQSEAEKSWKYFWERLKHSVLSHVSVHLDVAFPTEPDVFHRWFLISPDAYQSQEVFSNAWGDLIEHGIEAEGLEPTVRKALRLPIGGGSASGGGLARLLDSCRATQPQLQPLLLQLASETTNPVVLLNCLDALLSVSHGLGVAEDHMKNILRKLITPGEFTEKPQLLSSYKLYVAALRFAWCRMETLQAYHACPDLQRIVWAYAYASELSCMADDIAEHHDFEIDREALSKWMDSKAERSGTAVFENAFDEHLEVSHPMVMIPFRLVTSAAFRVLAEHKNELRWLSEELIRSIVAVTKSIVHGSAEGGWEIYKPFTKVRNFFLSPWGHNALASLEEVLEGSIKDRLSSLEETDAQIVTSVRGFDPYTLLEACLDRIINSQAWYSGDLLLIFLALSEPADPRLIPKIREAARVLNLDKWPEDSDFQLACVVLACCGISTKDPDICNQALGRLKFAWKNLAREPSHYASINDAGLKISLSAGEIARFYQWWSDAIDESDKELPYEVQGLGTGLAWTTPVALQHTLPDVRAKLAIR